MNRRLFSLALLASLLSPHRALADDDDDDDDETESGGDDDGGDDDSGSDGDDDFGSDDGNASRLSRGGDQDEARRAVETDGALPLDEMLAIFARRGAYTVLDVKLQRSNDTFLYVIKFIDGQSVRKSLFDARTGVLVK